MKLGNIYGFEGGSYAGCVYDSNSLSPALNTCGGGGREPHIVESVCVGGIGEKKSNKGTQYYQQDRVYTMGDIAMCQPSSLPGGSYNYIETKVVAMRGRDNGQQLEINNDGVNAITTVQKDNLLMEIQLTEDLSKWIWEKDGKKYLIRIRKLTPKECWRLMGFTDEDFHKAAEVNSNSMLYKQAGNSIVPQVLSAIFENLIGETS